MEMCECYHEIETFKPTKYTLVDDIRCECYGTKEKDVCTCGGDKTKCDFYPDVREKAIEELRIKLSDEELQAIWDELLKKNPPNLSTFDTCDKCEVRSNLAVLEKELKFYRWYIYNRDLLWDAANAYKKWSEVDE